MSRFNDILGQLSESTISEAVDKDGLTGIKINDKGTTIKFSNRDESDRARKAVAAFKKTNPSAGDKVLMRLAGYAAKMRGATTSAIISGFTLATTDAYKDLIN